MSSRLCKGSSSIVVDNGGFGTPIFKARNTETASAFTWELDKTAGGKSHTLCSIGSLTMVDKCPLPLNILDKNVKLPDKFMPCDKMGLCNPCDIKNKFDRFQETGHCSVTIKES